MSRKIKLAIAVLLCMISVIGMVTIGHAQDNNISIESLRAAADQGDPVAQDKLGEVYARGTQGVMQDEVEATKWYQKSADQGNADAEAELAHRYYYGEFGVPKDKDKAAKLFQDAAEKGNGNAKFELTLQKYPVLAFILLPAILIIPAILALWVQLVTRVVAKFKPSFKMAFKAALVLGLFSLLIVFRRALVEDEHIALSLVGLLAIIGGNLTGIIIKHPKTGPIGSRKGVLIFGISIVALFLIP